MVLPCNLMKQASDSTAVQNIYKSPVLWVESLQFGVVLELCWCHQNVPTWVPEKQSHTAVTSLWSHMTVLAGQSAEKKQILWQFIYQFCLASHTTWCTCTVFVNLPFCDKSQRSQHIPLPLNSVSNSFELNGMWLSTFCSTITEAGEFYVSCGRVVLWPV